MASPRPPFAAGQVVTTDFWPRWQLQHRVVRSVRQCSSVEGGWVVAVDGKPTLLSQSVGIEGAVLSAGWFTCVACSKRGRCECAPDKREVRSDREEKRPATRRGQSQARHR